jgi:hypothetical protein
MPKTENDLTHVARQMMSGIVLLECHNGEIGYFLVE